MEPGTRARTVPQILTIQPPLGSEKLDGELLPGIPNVITLNIIARGLSFKDRASLCSVSRQWELAVKSHMVHDARVRARSTETFAVVAQYCLLQRTLTLSLYSMKHQTFIPLPPIPQPSSRFPSFQCVSLDGKIYILGGDGPNSNESKVYMLDLAAGQTRWKQCASIGEPRQYFGAAVLNGKIYVFGGAVNREPISGATVYDPQVDSWSAIKPMLSVHTNPRAAVVGDELLVYDGHVANDHQASEQEFVIWPTSPSLEIYNPVRDEWRSIEPFEMSVAEPKFVAQGKLYALSQFHISAYDINARSLSHGPPWIFAQSELLTSAQGVECNHVLVEDNEVLLVLNWYGQTWCGQCLLHGKGFGQTQEIAWEIVRRSPRHCGGIFGTETYTLLCTIQL